MDLWLKNKKSGFTMIEVLLVIAVLAILIIMAITTLPRQLEKSRDAERKSDLQKIKIAFENYYNDNGCYPSQTVLEDYCNGTTTVDHELSPYMPVIPCDPKDNKAYLYAPYDKTGSSGTCDGFRVWANLEKNDDPVIATLNCDGVSGCGAYSIFGSSLGSAASDYNYGVSEGVPVFTGDSNTYLSSGFCCSNSPGDDCNAWNDSDPNNSCIVGPYITYSECLNNTVCTKP